MVIIKTDDIELLKDACEMLAYQVAQFEYPKQYCVSDEQIASNLKCQGLEVEIIE